MWVRHYYKGNNYAQALFYLKKIFTDEPEINRYHQLKSFAKKEDWEVLDLWCREILKEQKMDYQLALINLGNNDYEKVLAFVLEKPKYFYGNFEDIEKEGLAKRLLSICPEKLFPFYLEKVNRYIERMGRESYKKASSYAQVIKDIYLKYLKKPDEWKVFIYQIRKTHEKKPALLDEFKNL